MQYECFIEKPDKQVYDGDTLKDVWVLLNDDVKFDEDKEIFPGIWQTTRGIEAQIDIRLQGIDTPEKRPFKKGRTEESRQREKKASEKARQAVIGLLAKNENRFFISKLQTGKYAGRIVADVDVAEVDVATELIKEGHAVAYHGGTKQKFDDWYKRDKPKPREVPRVPGGPDRSDR